MGKHSKNKAPAYQTASYNTGGLFGSSTTSKDGTTYTPENWMTNTMNTVTGNYNNTLQSMLNNNFTTDPNFQAYQNQFNKQMTNYYNNNVLSDLARRGLVRSSGLQAANTDFANTLADKQLDLYDNYYSRLQNNLSNMLNTSNTLYNYMNGVNTGSQNAANNLNNYNLSKASTNSSIDSANTNNAIMSGGLSLLS